MAMRNVLPDFQAGSELCQSFNMVESARHFYILNRIAIENTQRDAIGAIVQLRNIEI